MNPSLMVSSAPSGVVLNVVQAPKVQVTGRVTLNGATPTLTCSASSPARIRFESPVDSHYDTVVEVPCVAAFTFSADLYPSTYKVSVSGTGYSNLPGWYVEVVERIALPAGSP